MQTISREVSGVSTRDRPLELIRRPSFRLLRRYLVLSLCVILGSGCATLRGHPSTSAGWLQNGSLALSRPVPPAISSDRARLSENKATALMSADVSSVVVSRSSRTITATQHGSAPQTFKADGAQHLLPGTFSITIKEDAPLWYAPDDYFTKRSLPVPEEGNRARFMRAALGKRALYLNNQSPIHSGPVWLDEIGGLRLKSSDMAILYSLVTVGTRVEVR